MRNPQVTETCIEGSQDHAPQLVHRENKACATCGKLHLVIIEVLIAKVAGQLIAQFDNFTELGGNMWPYSAHTLQST